MESDMGKGEKRVLTLDKYEHGVVLNALNEMRNGLIGEERPTDIVDEVLLKTIDAPIKKVRMFGDPERPDEFSGRGRATERGERSLRGRDEAR